MAGLRMPPCAYEPEQASFNRGAHAFEQRWHGPAEQQKEGAFPTLPIRPCDPGPRSSSQLPLSRTVYSYHLTLPFVRMGQAIIGASGSTQSNIKNCAALRRLDVHPPTPDSPSPVLLLEGTKSSIQEGLRLIRNVLMIHLHGQWYPAEWRALCGLANAATWEFLDESRLVPATVSVQGETDAFGRVVRSPSPDIAVPMSQPSASLRRPSSPSSNQRPRDPGQSPSRTSRTLPRFPSSPTRRKRDVSLPHRRSKSPSSRRDVRSPSPPRGRAFVRCPRPRSRSRSPPSRGNFVRYTVDLPFTEVAPHLIGHHGSFIDRLVHDTDLVKLDVDPPLVEKTRRAVLTGTRSAVRAALELIEERVYRKGVWDAAQWAVLQDRGIPAFAAAHFLANSPAVSFISSATGCHLVLSSSTALGTAVKIEGKTWTDVDEAKRDVERIVARAEKEE
ncbi:hypothetical protein JCM11251_001964 [Rhodosporidiobolus azoricus]